MKVPNVIKGFQETMASAKTEIDKVENQIDHMRPVGLGGDYKQEMEIYEQMLKKLGIVTLETLGKVPEFLAGDEYERD